MFETAVIPGHTQTARGRFSVLTASVIAHSALIIGIVAVNIASTSFPAMAPNEYSRAPVFMPVQIPPPLGHPNGGAQPKPATTTPVKPPAPPTQQTAPGTVPETITPASTSGTSESTATTTGEGTVEGPVGVPWGTKDSIGDLDAPPVPVNVPVQPEEKIYAAGEVNAPVLLSRVEPRYPSILMKAAPSATVVVRCVIDRNGNVRDPQVLVPAMPPFNAEVLNVITKWKYKPATYAGHPVDSYLDLTVHFSIRR
jgi:TonB family protein